jgi:hypothetical protein
MDRLDLIDPRLFLTLPEHVSNALHVWNRALLITQISHLDASVASSPYNNSNDLNNSHSKQSENNTDLLEQFLNDCKSQYTLQLNNNNNNNNNNANDKNEEFLKTLNETTLMKIFKIKKRNKASLLNLILPNLVLADVNNLDDATLTQQRSCFNLFDFKSNLTPPWRRATNEESFDTSSSNSSLDLCDGGAGGGGGGSVGGDSLSSSSSSQNENDVNESEKSNELNENEENLMKANEQDDAETSLDLNMGSRR